MTWFTRISWFDTMTDLHTALLLQQNDDAVEAVGKMIFPLLQEGHIAGGRKYYASYDDPDFANHPVARMWAGYETALAAYGAVSCVESVVRGYAQSGKGLKISGMISAVRWETRSEAPMELPPWKEDTDVLRSHRSNLVRRFPSHYSDVWSEAPEGWPYIWPFVDEDGGYGLFVSRHDRELLASGERKLPKDVKKRIENL